MNARELARYYAGGRVAIGLLLLLFPGRVLQGMLGGRAAVTPGVLVIGRMLGARDGILGVGTLTAMSPGSDDADVRAWLRSSAIADASDAAAMALAYRHLPKRKRFVMLAFALAGTATGAYLTTTLTAD
jgi:hypothetical protein